jgi:double zinc ribbon protein
MKESIVQLHSALVDALVRSRHHPADQPVTVAEIYQDLIPYRSVRSTIGFALNADYEHALLTLLAGDGGFARVEPAEVQAELRVELHSPNPNVGVFRNYAACDVFVQLPTDFEQRRARRQPGSSAAQPSVPGPVTTQPARPNGPPASAVAQSPPPARPEPPKTVALAGPIQVSTNPPEKTATCMACKKQLPSSRTARFCPFCGQDQTRCGRCREPVEMGWKYCVACGAAVP